MDVQERTYSEGRSDVPAELFPVLERSATWIVGSRAEELHTALMADTCPRSAADVLIENLQEAIEARAEIIMVADASRSVSNSVLAFVGPEAVGDERHQIGERWAEGGEDARGLAERARRLADLEDLLVLAGVAVTSSEEGAGS